MKIGIQYSLNDNHFGRYGDGVYRKMRDVGFDAVDFCMMGRTLPVYTLPRAEADALVLHHKELAAEAGIEIFQTHGAWLYPPEDATAAERAELFRQLRLSMEMTVLLDCKNFVMHPLFPFGTREKPEDAPETYRINLEFMREVLRSAHELGLTVCLENMPMHEYSLSTPDKILAFIEEIDDPALRMCFDTGHVNVFGLNAADELRRVKDKLQVLHVHDNMNGRDQHLPPPYGGIDWPAFGAALREIGYDGVFSYETWPSRKLPDDLFESMARLMVAFAHDITDAKPEEGAKQ